MTDSVVHPPRGEEKKRRQDVVIHLSRIPYDTAPKIQTLPHTIFFALVFVQPCALCVSVYLFFWLFLQSFL